MTKGIRTFYLCILTGCVMLPMLLYALIGKRMLPENLENRQLAEKPVFSMETIDAYPSAYETYFNDHLPFKDPLVFLNSYIDYRFLGTSSSESVIVGKDGWLFYKGAQVNDEDPIGDYSGQNLYSEEELQTIARNMTDAEETLEDMDAEFVILILPNKERIYSEYMPDTFGKPAERNRMTQVIDYLRTHTDLTVICPYEEIMTYRGTHPEKQLYYKYDTHWNNRGAYLGAGLLSKTLGFEMPALDDLREEDGTKIPYDLAKLLHLQDVLTDDPVYRLMGHTARTVKIERNETLTEFWGNNPNGDGDGRRLYLIGDSFSTLMFQYVACHFNESHINFYYDYRWETLVEDEPDIVVYETVERYMNNMLDFSLENGIGTGSDGA